MYIKRLFKPSTQHLSLIRWSDQVINHFTCRFSMTMADQGKILFFKYLSSFAKIVLFVFMVAHD